MLTLSIEFLITFLHKCSYIWDWISGDSKYLLVHVYVGTRQEGHSKSVNISKDIVMIDSDLTKV